MAVNGYLPAAMLAPVPWDTRKRVALTVLADLIAMNAAFRAHFGRNLVINEGYRDYATQLAYKARTYLPRSHPSYLRSAATPGTSVHGWGKAIDFGGIFSFYSGQYRWLAANAGAFGFYQPAQYRVDGRYPEYWHWEHPSDGPVARVAPALEEDDDVALTQAQAQALASVPEMMTLLQQIKTKMERHDLRFLYFVTPDGRPAVAQPGEMRWAIAPSQEVLDQHRWLMKQLGLVVEGTSVKDWDDVRVKTLGVAANGDVILDPEAFVTQVPWDLYPGGKH